MSQNNPVQYYTLIPGSFRSETLDTTGFVSTWINLPEFSTINISALIKTQAGILQIHTNSIREDDNKDLFFETTLDANTPFFRRFKIPNSFIRITFKTSSGTGKGYITTSLNNNNMFSAYSFINSPIKRNTDVELNRVANNFESDLVRELHTDFQKVNIQGVQKTIPGAGTEVTIGLTTNYSIPGNNPTDHIIPNANDNTGAGTGAQEYRISGVLFNGQAQTSVFGTQNTGGSLGLNFKAINRVQVTDTGTQLKNVGTMTWQEQGGSGEVLSFIEAGGNVSHVCIYGVQSLAQLVLRDINIAGRSDAAGIVKVIEMSSTGIEYTLGEFLINSTYQQFNYVLDGLVPADSVIKINFENTSSVTTGDILINVNANGMLCPLINSF